jgi:hypothetical protein
MFPVAIARSRALPSPYPPMPTPETPTPRSTERHPSGADYRAQLHNLRRYAGGAGSTVSLAEDARGAHLVSEEQDGGEALVCLRTFATVAERDAFAAAQYGRLRDRSVERATVRFSFRDKPLARPRSYEDLVQAFGARDLASPLRSTVPLLAGWRTPGDALMRLARALGESFDDDVHAAFEQPVPVQRVGDERGRGGASSTDLLLTTSVHAVAIEAKYTESSYQTVKQWLKHDQFGVPDENRRLVLAGWLELINRRTGADLSIESVKPVTYQLIHRTAAACLPEIPTWRAVVYLCFHESSGEAASETYRAQMAELAAVLGAQWKLHFAVIDVPIIKQATQEGLQERWAAGERELATEVRAGLIAGELVEWGEWGVTRV